jgi:ATP-dependent helicase YprA (DUF1998 family)
MSLDPLRTAEAVRVAYLRYLKTAFPLKEQGLSHQFSKLLEDPSKLVKGPYLEATPPFKPGASLKDLVNEGLLAPNFPRICSSNLPYERRLYVHQEGAIRKAVSQSRNLVVATGTGSGKTESFLVPILDHLLRQELKRELGPGVRALLLYPMNALANDQLKRLRSLLASYPSITFGRYTGETEENPRRAKERF